MFGSVLRIFFRCKNAVLRRVVEKQSHAGGRVAPCSRIASDEKKIEDKKACDLNFSGSNKRGEHPPQMHRKINEP